MNPMRPSHLDLTLCRIQADTFELSSDMDMDSRKFIECYMNSNVAERMDAEWDIIHGLGEKYVLKALEIDEGKILRNGEIWDGDVMHWIGYMYRFWARSRNISSREVYGIADAERMAESYKYHVVNCEQAIRYILDDIEVEQERRKGLCLDA